MKKFKIIHEYADGNREVLCTVDADEGQISKTDRGVYRLKDEDKEWVTLRAVFEEAANQQNHKAGQCFAVGDKIVFEEA